MITESQDEVVAFLADPRSYWPPASVERIDTHCSSVFLTGDRAYKLKRAVRYDYLDFSTRERRRAACEAELAVNRRLAPALYLGVLAITKEGDGRLAFDGTGRALDSVVVMKRFEQDALFDRLASRQQLELDLMDDLAHAVAAAHAAAPWRVDRGGRAGIAWVVDGNADGFAAEGAGLLDADRCRRVIERSREEIGRHAALLDARRASGHVRECHGDLHLRNIVLFEGRPTLFDAVEFNDRISCIDVLYDAAFLVMDLWRLRLSRHANAFFNHYLEESGELGGLPLLPLFLSCRSAVRAKTSATAARLQPDPRRAAELRHAARGYLADAEALLHPPAPRLIALGGFAGTGKSTIARRIAPGIGPVPGAVILRSDVVRKKIFGVAPTTRLPRSAYVRTVTDRVYRRLADDARRALRAGHSVIVDAVAAAPRQRAAFADVARAAGVPFTGMWLHAPFEVAASRIVSRHADASDATTDVLRDQQARDPGPIDWVTIDASDGIDAVARRVEEELTVNC